MKHVVLLRDHRRLGKQGNIYLQLDWNSFPILEPQSDKVQRPLMVKLQMLTIFPSFRCSKVSVLLFGLQPFVWSPVTGIMWREGKDTRKFSHTQVFHKEQKGNKWDLWSPYSPCCTRNVAKQAVPPIIIEIHKIQRRPKYFKRMLNYNYKQFFYKDKTQNSP